MRTSEDNKMNIKFMTSPHNGKAKEFKGFFDNWNGINFKVSGQMSSKLKVKPVLKCAYLTVFSRIGYDLLFGK
ncbi:hypothetical protein [Sphingobacterium bovistauri]|uniref:Uncharacterized protein n=1 Tax=Sphingobacterium bovistauri TaxID=2781959 RepID=A0ABS7Z627_9SPHI|nr:hypothetical protein [Sphingobacterium bovistauri]MCA5005648.1 hypothetical protein [Sphingobacterium bovistauri]